MKRLTPSEFYEQSTGFDLSPIQGQSDMDEIFAFALAYAEHLEQTAWVSDGSLPPVGVRVNVLLENGNVSSDVAAYYPINGANTGKQTYWVTFTTVVAWRPFPTSPNQ